MNNQPVFFFSIRYRDNLPIRENQIAGIANLPAAFGIKRGFIQYQLVLLFAFSRYFAVLYNVGNGFRFIVTGKLNGVIFF